MEHDASLPFPDRDEAVAKEPEKAMPEAAEPVRAEPESEEAVAPERSPSTAGQNKKPAAGRKVFPPLGGSNLARRYVSER